MGIKEQSKLPAVVRWMALLMPTILLLLLGEWLAATYLKHRFGDDFDLVVQATGQMAPSGYQLWEHPENYWSWSKLSRFNNLGFRRLEDTSVRKPPRTVRIFITGGSGALGSAANPAYPWRQMSGQAGYGIDQTISAHLERLLGENNAELNYEVINAATNWSQLHQQLLHYFRKLRFLEPDLVISIDGQNDVLSIDDQYLSAWDLSRRMKVPILNENIRVQLRPLIARSNLLFLAAGTVFGQHRIGTLPSDGELVERYKVMGKPDDYDERMTAYMSNNAAHVEKGVGAYLNDMQHYLDAMQREGTRALFVQQPQLVLDSTKRLTDIETAMKNYIYNDAADAYAENFLRALETEGNRLREEEGVPFYSFLNIFGGEEGEVYTDYTHLTPRANEVVADRLMSLIRSHYPELVDPI